MLSHVRSVVSRSRSGRTKYLCDLYFDQHTHVAFDRSHAGLWLNSAGLSQLITVRDLVLLGCKWTCSRQNNSLPVTTAKQGEVQDPMTCLLAS